MKITFIANPVSGGKSKEKILQTITDRIDTNKYSYEIRMTERPGHATEIARDCDSDVVVAVGGDGTVSEVAQGILAAERPKNLGIVPCGSGDGLALHLGISRHPCKAVDVLNKGRIVEIDHATLNGKPFFCTAGVGLDAQVAWEFASSRRRGLWTYISTAWRLWQHFVPDTYTITVDGKTVTLEAVMVTAGNVNQWGNNARITPLASVCDGQLDVTAVLPFKTWRIPGLAWKLLTGKAHKSRFTRLFKGASVDIVRTQAGPAHYDGDPLEMGDHLELRIMPHTLQAIVP